MSDEAAEKLIWDAIRNFAYEMSEVGDKDWRGIIEGAAFIEESEQDRVARALRDAVQALRDAGVLPGGGCAAIAAERRR